MKSAKYGRMEFGRCIDRDWGYLGCFIDVLNVADKWCSGRRSCQIPIPNASFRKQLYSKTECPRDLNPYFSASFQCVKVETAESQHCKTSSFIVPSSQNSGFLANYVTKETDKGSDICPWIIQAKKGQRINITLYDFSRSENQMLQGVHETGYDVCHVYAVLRERSDHTEHMTEHSICGGGYDRIKYVYVTEGHLVEIKIMSYRSVEDVRYFLIKYEVQGCEEPEPIENSWMKYVGQDQVMIGCRSTESTWSIQCVNHKWEGTVGNCTEKQEDLHLVSLVLNLFPIPNELAVVIVIVIAVTITIVIITLAACCAKGLFCKSKKSKPSTPQHKSHSKHGSVMNGNSTISKNGTARRSHRHDRSNTSSPKPIQAVQPTTKTNGKSNSSMPNTDSSELLLNNSRSSDDLETGNALPPPPAFLMEAGNDSNITHMQEQQTKDHPAVDDHSVVNDMPPPPPVSPAAVAGVGSVSPPPLPPPYHDAHWTSATIARINHGRNDFHQVNSHMPGHSTLNFRSQTPDLLQQQRRSPLLTHSPRQHNKFNTQKLLKSQQRSFDSAAGCGSTGNSRKFGHRRMPSDVTIKIERSPVHSTNYKTYNPKSSHMTNNHTHNHHHQNGEVPHSAGYQPNPHNSFEFPPPPPELLRQASDPAVEKHRVVRFQDVPNGDQSHSTVTKGMDNKYQGLLQKLIPNNNNTNSPNKSNTAANVKHDSKKQLQKKESSDSQDQGDSSQTYGSFSSKILSMKPPTEDSVVLDPRRCSGDEKTYFELDPDIMSSPVPFEYGYSVKTGQKFRIYHGDQNGKLKGKKLVEKSPKKPRFITNSTV